MSRNIWTEHHICGYQPGNVRCWDTHFATYSHLREEQYYITSGKIPETNPKVAMTSLRRFKWDIYLFQPWVLCLWTSALMLKALFLRVSIFLPAKQSMKLPDNLTYPGNMPSSDYNFDLDVRCFIQNCSQEHATISYSALFTRYRMQKPCCERPSEDIPKMKHSVISWHHVTLFTNKRNRRFIVNKGEWMLE